MIVLSQSDLAELLPMATAIEVVGKAMVEVSAGRATLPLRSIMPLQGNDRMGVMPGAMVDPPAFGMKLISLFPGNPDAGYSSHEGAMLLFEAKHGTVLGIMNAGLLTAIRTAAASAVATRALARPDSTVLTIVGAGEQARHHLDAMLCIAGIETLRIVGRRPDKAHAFANEARQLHPAIDVTVLADIREAVTGADIVCTTTTAVDAIVMGDWIGPGTHLNVVGSSIPSMREIDEALLLKAQLFVDYRGSTFAQAGEVIAALEAGVIGRDHVRAEIGEVLAGSHPGRGGAEAITLYRSLGIAAQDIACASHCLAEAGIRGIGVEASLG